MSEKNTMRKQAIAYARSFEFSNLWNLTAEQQERVENLVAKLSRKGHFKAKLPNLRLKKKNRGSTMRFKPRFLKR
jgi:hypothetical protein